MLSRKLLPKNVTNVIKGFACQCRNYSQNEVNIKFSMHSRFNWFTLNCVSFKKPNTLYCALCLIKLLLLCIRAVNCCKSCNAQLPKFSIFNECNFYSCEHTAAYTCCLMNFYMCNGIWEIIKDQAQTPWICYLNHF